VKDEPLSWPHYLSVVALGCFAGAAWSYFQFGGRHLELLILCGVIHEAAAAIVVEIQRLRRDTQLIALRRAGTEQ
jgi:hypothetical protein